MKKAYRGQKKLGELTASVAMPAAQRYGMAMFKIITNWSYIVGVELSEHTTPKGLLFQPGKTTAGVLQIEVENPGFSLELQASELVIVQKIATFFGYQAIDKIKVSIARTRKPNLKTTVPIDGRQQISQLHNKTIHSNITKIEDEELRHALESLAKQSFSVDE